MRATLAGRYGLLEETELLGEIAYERERRRTELGPFGASTDTEGHWSSLSLGLRRTLVCERLGVPNVVLTLGGSAPLGNTSYSVGAGIATVSSLDPNDEIFSPGGTSTWRRPKHCRRDWFERVMDRLADANERADEEFLLGALRAIPKLRHLMTNLDASGDPCRPIHLRSERVGTLLMPEP